MYCPYCGAALPEEKEFCEFCGKSLGDKAQATPQGAQTQQQYQEPNSQQAQGAQYQGQQNQNPQYQQPTYQQQYVQKSRLAAGLLQIFLGGFGVGRFYLGYTGVGVAQLLVSIFTCGIGAIWALIDGILIITGTPNIDANGVPLRD